MWCSAKWSTASMTSLITLCKSSVPSDMREKARPKNPARPSRSRAMRSSGWKITTSAMMPGTSIRLSSQLNVGSQVVTATITITTNTPLISETAAVRRTIINRL